MKPKEGVPGRNLGVSFVPETPDVGRAKRKSTILSSTATRSLINQQQQFDSPDVCVGGERTVVGDTPDPQQLEHILQTDMKITESRNKNRRGRVLPSLPSEETFVAQSQDVFSSTCNPPPQTSGGSSSRRKKGKPLKIVQWDPENQNYDANFDNRDVIESQNYDNNKKIYESVNTKHIQVSKSSNGKRSKNEETLTSNLKTNLSLNSSQFFEETYVYDDKSPPVSSKNKTRRLSKSKRMSTITDQDFVNFILQKEKSPEPLSKGPVGNSVASDSEDDGWDVLTNEDGSIKKFLPKSNRKSVVISGNIKSRTKDLIKGADRAVPKSRKNLSKELSAGEPGQANSTVIPGPRSRRSNRIYSVSQLSDVPYLDSSHTSKENNALSGPETSTCKQNESRLPESGTQGTKSSETTVSISAGYAGLSFQNFSSDSVKAVMNQLENGGWDSDLAKKLEKPKTIPSQPSSNDRPCKEIQEPEIQTMKAGPGRKSIKRKLSLELENGTEKKRKSDKEKVEKRPRIEELPATPQRVGLKVKPRTDIGEKTSLTPQPMDICESPARRSGRQTTQISTLASDGLARSPSLARYSPVQSTFKSPAQPPQTNNQEKKDEKNDEKNENKKDGIQTDLNSSLEELPCTQAAPLFENLVFFIELRDGRENRSKAGQNRVRKYGATVSEKINKKVTHVIFHGGTKSNYLKAKKLNLPILSILWVFECINEGKLVSTARFPSPCCEPYDQGKFPSLRKLKSIHIRSVEEGWNLFQEKKKKEERAKERKKKKEDERKKALFKSKPIHPLYYEGSPYVVEKKEEDKLLKILNEIKSPSGSPFRKEFFQAPSTPIWEDEDELDLSLADRLIHRYKKNKALARLNSDSCLNSSADTPLRTGDTDSRTRTGDKDTTTVRGSQNVTQSSSLDTTGKPRRFHQLSDSTLLASPIMSQDQLFPSSDTADQTIKRRSNRQSTQICTKASNVLAIQQSPLRESTSVDRETSSKLTDDISSKQISVSGTGGKNALSSGVQPTVTEAGKRRLKVGRKRLNMTLELEENTKLGAPNLESTRLSVVAGNSISNAGDKDPMTLTAAASKTSKASASKQTKEKLSKPFQKSASKLLKESAINLNERPDDKPASTKIPLVPKDTSTLSPIKSVSSSPTKPKTPGELENDRLFDALLTSNQSGRKSSGSPPRKKFVLSQSLVKKTQEDSKIREKNKSAYLKSMSSNSKQIPAALLHSSVRSPSSAEHSFPSPTHQIRSPAPAINNFSSPQLQESSRVCVTKDVHDDNITSNAPKPSSSLEKVPKKGPESTEPVVSPRSRIVAPWRNQEQDTPAPVDRDSSNQDIYEFEGFPDDIGASEVSPSKRKYRTPVSENRATKFGRPTNHKMFLVAPKRKLEDSRSAGKHQSQSPKRNDKSPLAHDSSSFKSQLSDSLSKRHGETSPLCVKSSSWRSEGSPRQTEGSPWRSESSLQRSEPPPIRKENPSLPAESSSVQGKNKTTIMNSLPEEPKKPAKNAVLSRVFSKPPAKDSESTENLVTDKKESRTAKKHKLYSQNLLDETARNSPDINLKQVENVQFSNVKTKTVIKSKPSKEVKTRGSKDLFKKPKSKKATIYKSTEESDQSEADSMSSNQSESSNKSDQSTSRGRKRKATLARRSSMDFAPLPRFIQKMEEKKMKDSINELTTSRYRRKGTVPSKNIVCTSCSQDDISLVNQLVKSYGRFTFSTSVNSRTSHVVSGEGKRTLNLLKGLLQGCWIVTKEWVLSSLEAEHWVDEEPYEMVDFSPAVRNLRLERSTWGGMFKSELFKEIGTIYISVDCRAPRDELKQLIQSGGGLVSQQARLAQVVVGEESRDNSVHSVTEKWILDSVQFHLIMLFSDYPI